MMNCHITDCTGEVKYETNGNGAPYACPNHVSRIEGPRHVDRIKADTMEESAAQVRAAMKDATVTEEEFNRRVAYINSVSVTSAANMIKQMAEMLATPDDEPVDYGEGAN